jgi:hypothetical protein
VKPEFKEDTMGRGCIAAVVVTALVMVLLSGFGVIQRISGGTAANTGWERQKTPSFLGYRGQVDRYLKETNSEGSG